MVKSAVESANRLNPVARKQQPGTGIMADLDEKSELSEDQFADLLKKIDNGLRALPATAQVPSLPHSALGSDAQGHAHAPHQKKLCLRAIFCSMESALKRILVDCRCTRR